MTPGVGFVVFLFVTLCFLGAVVVTGLTARRKLHLRLVVGAFISLAIAIYYAERLGESYDVDSAGMITPIHLTLAKVTVFAYLLPVLSGWRTIKNAANRPLHGKIAYTVLALTVLTAATGVLMILLADKVA